MKCSTRSLTRPAFIVESLTTHFSLALRPSILQVQSSQRLSIYAPFRSQTTRSPLQRRREYPEERTRQISDQTPTGRPDIVENDEKHEGSDSDQLVRMQGKSNTLSSSDRLEAESLKSQRRNPHTNRPPGLRPQLERWQIQKRALEEKFGPAKWEPRKRLSPDTLLGIRSMHASDPTRFTTPVLADQFKVSPEAIRRILKSKWQPNAEEVEDRQRRWDNRGQRIWTNLAEMGTRPPKKWRQMGVGKGEDGEPPMWKRQPRRSSAPSVKAPVDIIATRALPEKMGRGHGSEIFSDRML